MKESTFQIITIFLLIFWIGMTFYAIHIDQQKICIDGCDCSEYFHDQINQQYNQIGGTYE